MRRPALFILGFALLALFFGWETRQAWLAPPAVGDNAAQAPAGTWQPGAPIPDPPPPQDVAGMAAAVAARPLFRPDRQPFKVTPASVMPQRNYEAELSRFSLLGILAIGDQPKGIVVGKAGAQAERWELVSGDSLPGFTVKEVRPDGLLVTADDREFLLPLYAGPPTAVKGGPVRTEAPRKESTPASAPAPPRPAAQSPAPAVPAGQPAPVAPMAQPAPAPPAVAPKYIPGRR